jgi:hypothetical protein
MRDVAAEGSRGVDTIGNESASTFTPFSCGIAPGYGLDVCIAVWRKVRHGKKYVMKTMT